jgi:hypothetical protein
MAVPTDLELSAASVGPGSTGGHEDRILNKEIAEVSEGFDL